MIAKKFFNKYYDFSNPGSFSGISGFKKNNPEFKNKNIKQYLEGSNTYTLHKKYIKKFPRTKFYAKEIDHMWQIDLIDLSNLRNKFFSQNYGYVLTCIDVFSRYAWVEPLKNKTAYECKKAIERIFNKGRQPSIIYSDAGSEFEGEFRKYLEKMKIIQLTNQNVSHIKAAVIERFNKTIKEKLWRVFTYLGKKKYSDVLQKLVYAYNHSIHRSIGIAPVNVTKKNQDEIHNYQFGDIESPDNFIVFKFKIGDYVRVIKDLSDKFEKGYVQKWSNEIFVVDHQNPTNPPTYTINNISDTDFEIRKFYYAEELQKVQPKEFPYDTYEVEIGDTVTVTKLNDANQEKKVVEESIAKRLRSQKIKEAPVSSRLRSKKR